MADLDALDLDEIGRALRASVQRAERVRRERDRIRHAHSPAIAVPNPTPDRDLALIVIADLERLGLTVRRESDHG